MPRKNEVKKVKKKEARISTISNPIDDMSNLESDKELQGRREMINQYEKFAKKSNKKKTPKKTKKATKVKTVKKQKKDDIEKESEKIIDAIYDYVDRNDDRFLILNISEYNCLIMKRVNLDVIKNNDNSIFMPYSSQDSKQYCVIYVLSWEDDESVMNRRKYIADSDVTATYNLSSRYDSLREKGVPVMNIQTHRSVSYILDNLGN